MACLSLSFLHHRQATSKAKASAEELANLLLAIGIKVMEKALVGRLAMVWLTIDTNSSQIDLVICMEGCTSPMEWVQIDHTSLMGHTSLMSLIETDRTSLTARLQTDPASHRMAMDSLPLENGHR